MAKTAVLHLWGVSPARVPQALLLTAAWQLARRSPQAPAFGKALGTGSGMTFTLRDSDPRHWALLTVWPDAAQAQQCDSHWLVRAWDSASEERLRISMQPVSARGSWSGAAPLSPVAPGQGQTAALHTEGLGIAAITRARVKPRHWRTFARSVPPVSADLHAHAGPFFALGIGEAPIGLQGTFSLWRSHADIDAFAYRREAHRNAIAQTAALNWYAEEMFARLTVTACEGTYRGATVITP